MSTIGLPVYCRSRRAWSIAEILWILLMLALLATVLLPSLGSARAQGRRGMCLSNLKTMGTASQIYAAEDAREQLMPIHARMLEPSPKWYWKTVHAFVFGGVSASRRLPFDDADGVFLNYREGQGANTPGAAYGRDSRPFNRILFSGALTDEGAVKLHRSFSCPNDTGFPTDSTFEHAPPAAAGIPLHEMLGTSYRANLHAAYRENGEALAVGPWGHRLSTLRQTGRLIAFHDALLLDMAWSTRDGETAARPVSGWHSPSQSDSALFADGSARTMRDMRAVRLTHEDAAAMSLNAAGRALTLRGASWSFDAWPTPGAVIFGKWPSGAGVESELEPGTWPLLGMQTNMRQP